MADLQPAADSPDPLRLVRSIACTVRMRLEGEARAGLTAVRRGRHDAPQAASPAASEEGSAPAALSGSPAASAAGSVAAGSVAAGSVAAGSDTETQGPTPEDKAAETLRRELEEKTSGTAVSQDLFNFGSPDLEGGVSRQEALTRIAAEVAACDRCRELAAGRTNTVPGQGSPNARLVFVGEGPGQEEDRQGLAFVGRAGELLTKMIEAIGMTRDQVFICNIVKCRPPNNRVPMPDEAANCMPYLMRQLEILRPHVICAVGGTAAKWLLQTDDGITRLRGRFHPYRGVPLMPTFHPAYVLRNYTPDTRKKVYDDLLKVKAKLDELARAT